MVKPGDLTAVPQVTVAYRNLAVVVFVVEVQALRHLTDTESASACRAMSLPPATCWHLYYLRCDGNVESTLASLEK